MTLPEARESYELFLIGVLEEPERSEVRALIGADPAGVAAAAGVVASLGILPDAADPPARLRTRVLSAAGRPARKRAWFWTLLAAAGVLALLFTTTLRRERAQLSDALAILNAPDTIVRVSSGAKVFVNPTRGVLLLASNLPPAPEGRIYQMWLLPLAGQPIPAGLFQSESAGTAMHLLKRTVDFGRIGAIAVTVEPSAGSAQPTSAPFLVTRLENPGR